MRTAQQDPRTAHRFVDSDGVSVDVVGIGAIGTQAFVDFVRQGGRFVYRMKRCVFEATFAPASVPRIRQAANEPARRLALAAPTQLALAA